MRLKAFPALLITLTVFGGCERRSEITGPTVNKFLGKLVSDGKPVTFKAGDTVVLQLTHSTAQSFGVPIKADGTFDVGMMPIGKYTAQLRIDPAVVSTDKGSRSAPQKVTNVPGGFEIVDGQTEYTVELGKGFKL